MGGTDQNRVGDRQRSREQPSGTAGRLIAASKRRLAACLEQYERDLFQCNLVGLKTCYQQAAVRWIACEKGHPIPPLNY